MIYIAPLYYE